MAGTVTRQGILSPELVLIDPGLAAEVRTSMFEPHDALAEFEGQPAPSIADETAAARRRLIELSVVAPPRQRRRLRVTKLVGAMATWTVVVLLAVDTQLYTLFR
jgi:hypothetical protein